MADTIYKLTYFNSRGAAEVTRILFRLAGQEFEDVRIPRENWPALKPSMPFGQLPVLEIDGFNLAQSKAIQRYVARQFGYAGNSPLEQAEVDAYVYLVDDMLKPWRDMFHVQDQTEKDRLLEIAKTKTKEVIALFEKKLGDNKYLVGSELTMADVQLMCVFDFLTERHSDLAEQFIVAKAHYERIADIPKIKAWITERPKTEF